MFDQAAVRVPHRRPRFVSAASGSAGGARILSGATREALAHPGPVVVECVVDQNEPPLPGKIRTTRAIQFAKALARGEKDRVPIVQDVVKTF